jgi:hypothetical protein
MLWQQCPAAVSAALAAAAAFGGGGLGGGGGCMACRLARLVALHGLNLSEAELGQLLELVGGHPYLVRKALYELANGLPFATYLREAPTEAGVYGDHLRGILKAVEDHPELAEALRQVVNSSEPMKLRSEQAFKLESLGVLVPEANLVRPRCRLYATYLADRLAR